MPIVVSRAPLTPTWRSTCPSECRARISFSPTAHSEESIGKVGAGDTAPSLRIWVSRSEASSNSIRKPESENRTYFPQSASVDVSRYHQRCQRVFRKTRKDCGFRIPVTILRKPSGFDPKESPMRPEHADSECRMMDRLESPRVDLSDSCTGWLADARGFLGCREAARKVVSADKKGVVGNANPIAGRTDVVASSFAAIRSALPCRGCNAHGALHEHPGQFVALILSIHAYGRNHRSKRSARCEIARNSSAAAATPSCRPRDRTFRPLALSRTRNHTDLLRN